MDNNNETIAEYAQRMRSEFLDQENLRLKSLTFPDFNGYYFLLLDQLRDKDKRIDELNRRINNLEICQSA
jgi:hypothetical protein